MYQDSVPSNPDQVNVCSSIIVVELACSSRPHFQVVIFSSFREVRFQFLLLGIRNLTCDGTDWFTASKVDVYELEPRTHGKT